VRVDASDDPGRLNGVYRFSLALDDLVAAGVEPSQAVNEYGVRTVALRDGSASVTWRSRDNRGRCDGTYTVGGGQAELVLPRCGVDIRFGWRASRGDVHVTRVEPGQSAGDALLERAIWGTRSWKRVGDGPAATLPPDGVYRATIDRPELERAGLNDEQIGQENGIQTLTISHGRFTHDTRTRGGGRGVCRGRLQMAGGRVRWLVDPGPCAGPTSLEVFNARWVRTADGFRLLDVRSDNLAVRTVFGNRVWKKIG
jgi:hypothetical protein